jgi:hypothetical protein
MKIYKIKFNDGYTKKTYLIAEVSNAMALASAVLAETIINRDGTTERPSLDWFESEVIDGISARTAGIKSIIY